MCTCEFCLTQFSPRPQVKKPRACPDCQMRRQRDNENRWRKQNPRYSYALYYLQWRKDRDQRLKAAAESLAECIRVGKDLLGVNVGMKELAPVLREFLSQLGIRRINKFWNEKLTV